MTWNRHMYPMAVLGALGLIIGTVLPPVGQVTFICGVMFGVLFSVACVVSVPNWREELREDLERE